MIQIGSDQSEWNNYENEIDDAVEDTKSIVLLEKIDK